MKGKIANKIVMLIFICMLTMFDVFVVSKQIVQADGEEIEQEKTEISIQQGIEKYFSVAENKVILQQRVDVNLNKDDKTKISENLIINAPEIGEQIPESAIVLLNGVKLSNNTYYYDAEKLEVNIDREQGISQFDNKQNSYQIIYTYSELEMPENISITLNATVNANIDGEGEITATNEQQIETSINGTDISVMGGITEEVYKGYLYQGIQFSTSYSEINRIEISNLDNVENITINNVSEKFVEEDIAINRTTNEEEIIETENDINQSLYYRLTKINKEEMLRILGNDGKVTIYNQNDEILVEFNKDTETDEEGNIVFEYNGEEVTNVKIVTTKPVQEGKLDIYHDKSIKANTGYAREDIEKFDYLRETIQANNATTVMNMKLTEPTTQYDVTLGKTEYSTMSTNTDIDVSVILKNNQNSMSLYENPEIEIAFPQEVQSLEIQDQINVLYDSELSIRDYYVEGNVIHILLNGVQTNYKEVGTQINLKVNMTFDKKLTNRTSEIVTVIRNKNEEVENRKQVSILSPREMITVNNVQELGIESYGEEPQVIASLEKNSAERNVQIESEVINNTGNTTSVKILGELPTDSSNNNLGTIINTPVQVAGVNARVYYSTNENATEDLNDASNQWVEDANIINNAKKYLIAIDEMGVDNVAQFLYNVTVPANLEYNQQATQSYTVYYTDPESNISNRAESTKVLMTTGDGPVLEAQLIAKVNGKEVSSGDSVNAGETVTYEINITNTGTGETTNTNVSLNISESNNEEATQTINSDVGVIQPDETKTLQYDKEISVDLSTEETSSAITQISYDDEVINTDEIVLNVEPANIVGEVYWGTIDSGMDEDIQGDQILSQGGIVEFNAIITNNTSEVQDNLTLEWTLPEYCEISAQNIIDNHSYEIIEELEANSVIELRELQPRETITIALYVYLGEFDERQQTAYASAVVRQGEEIYHLGKTEDKTVNNIDKFFEITLDSPNEGEYLKPGEEIDYIITVKNDNIRSTNITITDEISSKLTITDIIGDVENANIDVLGNNITISDLNLAVGETKTITIKTVVDYRENDEEVEEISNQATLINGVVQIDTNVVTHYIDRYVENPDDPDTDNPDPDDPDNPNPDDPDPDNPDPDNPGQIETYRISGRVWLDTSLEGRKDDSEGGINGINVYLLNAQTNQLTNISASTNTDGSYTLSNIPNGQYIVVFDYSSTRYGLTKYKVSGVEESRNSKAIAKSINIFGTEKTYGVTDTITIDGRSVGNISMGLIELDDFDLKIDKYINRVIVKTSNSTNVYSYNNANLARVDLDAKTVDGSQVTVEYAIRVTNVGQIDGYVKRIVDNLPEGFTFDASQNKDWYGSGNTISSVIFANDKIVPGDSKTVYLTLTKSMTGEETGNYTNSASIEESYNEFNIQDRNVNGGVDQSSAELLLSIRTGATVTYILLTFIIIAIIGIGIYVIKIKVLNVKNEERR